tara:strand:- start:123 stop:326 length:204 start_codon:yes stop_codon:yes gene_type:complete
MTDKIIKKMLKNFDLDLLNSCERLEFNELNLPKEMALLKIIDNDNDLSGNLSDIKYFISDYKLTIKI